MQSQPQPQLTQTEPRAHGKPICEQSFPQLFALVISVDKLFEMLVLFFV